MEAQTLAENFASTHNNTLPGGSRTEAELQNQTIEELARFNELNNETSTLTEPSEIKFIIHRIKNKKVPGLNGSRNIMLYRIPRKGLVYLTKVYYNACKRLTYFPGMWKHANVMSHHSKAKQRCYSPTKLWSPESIELTSRNV